MKQKFTYLLFLLTFSTIVGIGSMATAQTVSGVSTTTGCSGGGTITASSTGISTPQYQLLQGTTVVLPDASNPTTYTNVPIFSGLTSGGYTLRARQDAVSTVYTSAIITVANGYTAMTVVTPTKVVSCATSATDLITTATGGKANYTYSIFLQGAPLGSPPIKTSGPITATTYTFSAMPIGNYLVSVTDNCGNTVTGATNISSSAVPITNIKPFSVNYLLPTGGVGICSSPLAMIIEGGWVYSSGGTKVSQADASLFTWKVKYKGILYGSDVTGDGYGDATGVGIPLSSERMIMPMAATRAGILIDYSNMKIVVSDQCGNTKEFAVYDYNANSSNVSSTGSCSGMPIIKAFLGAGMACLPLDITFTNSANAADKVTFNVTSGSESFLGTGLTPGQTYNLTYLDAAGYTTNVYKTTSITIAANSNLTAVQYPVDVIQYFANGLGFAQPNLIVNPALPTDLITYTVISSDNPSVPVGYTSSKLYGNPSGGISLNKVNASDPTNFWPKGKYVLRVTTPCGVVDNVPFNIGGYTANITGYTTTPICGGFNYMMNGTFGDGTGGNIYSAFEVVMLSPGGGTQKRDMANSTSSLSFDGLTPGTYVFALRIKGGTTNVLTQTVVYNAASVITIDKANTGGFVCSAGATNGVLTIMASSASPGTGNILQYAISLDGGTTYSAYQSGNTFPNLPSGIYSFKVKDGCSNEITNTAQIGVAATPTATANGLASTAQVCKTVGGTMSLDVDVVGTGVTYTWSGPGITNTVGDPAYKGLKSPVISLDGLTAGLQNYSVSVLNPFCSATATVSRLTANINALPTATIVYSTVICKSDAVKSVTLTGQTGGTYTALPAGLTINTTTGEVTPSTSTAGTYTVTYSSTNGTCTNATTTSVTINELPVAPAVSTTAATCSASGTAIVTNYVATNTYTFLQTGPSVGAGGAITGMVAGTSYTLTTNNGSCTSAASASFSIAAMLPAPTAPAVSTTAATCSTSGTAIVTNYIATNTYTFLPIGPSVGAGGAISGMVAGTSYTLTTNNGSCISAASASFSIAAMLPAPTAPTSTTAATCSAVGKATVSNYVTTNTYAFLPTGPSVGAGGAITGMVAGTSYILTTNNGSCTSAASASFSIAAMLATPTAPTVTTTAATCSAIGKAAVSNYVATNTYTFLPTGPSVGAGGVITGMVAGTSYILTTNNGSCTSAASASFSIAAMLPAPTAPAVSTTAATCSAIGTATVSNYVATNTYTFLPTGPSVGAGGVITGMVAGTSYTLTTNNGSCTSAASASFSIAAVLPAPTAPAVSTTAATCSASGTAIVTNYVATNTYTFLPTGPSVGAGGAITGMVAGTSYTLTTNNGSCTSAASAIFSIAAMLPVPTAPAVSTTAATCSASGTAIVTNYIATNTYTFLPIGPSVGAGGAISGMVAGTSYTVTTNNGNCTSTTSASFSIAAMLTTPTANISYSASQYQAVGTTNVVQAGQAGGTYTSSPSGLSINPTTGAINLGNSIPNKTYIIIYAFSNGSCNNSTSTSVTVNSTPATIAYAKTRYCATGTANVIQTGPVGGIYTSSGSGLKINSTSGLINLGSSLPGIYTVTYTYQDGTITASTTTSITVNAMPVLTLVSNLGTQVSKGDIITLTATGGLSYIWTGTDIQSGQSTAVLTVRPKVTTTYTVTATNTSGCSDVMQITIVVKEDLKLIPNNIITPNGDGKNDFWTIKNLDYYPNNKVFIYDRAGRKVFGAEGYQNNWDGTYNGLPLAEAAYFYVIDMGKGYGLIRGTINIIRDNK
ncbi:MAG: gliding motility-associated C-terminal domain-containing protein [Pedobacter sp.]|nr:MAG: gliding motility-associated C-terminal domain-containing protein [Pedobacter sp.]